MHLCKQESECQFYSNSKVGQMYQCCSGCNQICSKKKTAATTVLITGVIEGAFAAHEISKLREQRNKNHIDQKDYKREVTKTVSGAAGATVGSVGAGLIGQAICPIPFIGFALGSAAGNYFGRGLASVVSGQIFDA